jgi:hypothetical protein
MRIREISGSSEVNEFKTLPFVVHHRPIAVTLALIERARHQPSGRIEYL